jgi:hypothetical protein
MGFFGKVFDSARSLGKKVAEASSIGKQVMSGISKYAPVASNIARGAGFSSVSGMINKAGDLAGRVAPHMDTVTKHAAAIGNFG